MMNGRMMPIVGSSRMVPMLSSAMPKGSSLKTKKMKSPACFILVGEIENYRRYKFKCPDPRCQNYAQYVDTPWLVRTSNKYRCPADNCRAKKQKNFHTIPAALMRQHLNPPSEEVAMTKEKVKVAKDERNPIAAS